MFQAKVAAGEGAFSECAVGRALCNARKLSGRCHAIKGASPAAFIACAAAFILLAIVEPLVKLLGKPRR